MAFFGRGGIRPTLDDVLNTSPPGRSEELKQAPQGKLPEIYKEVRPEGFKKPKKVKKPNRVKQ